MAERAETISRFVTNSTPFVLGLFGVILLALPVRLAEGLIPMPILPLVMIYFWTLYEPEKLPASLVFVLGLLQDALGGGPFGLWSTVYLLVQFGVVSQRGYFLGRDTKVVWLGFAIVAVAAGIVVWLVLSLIARGLLPLTGISLQILVTICVYPVLGAGFGNIRRTVLLDH
ncbi:MAG: rod shape-determining protein MreD [Pseudomonadota bacterium]